MFALRLPLRLPLRHGQRPLANLLLLRTLHFEKTNTFFRSNKHSKKQAGPITEIEDTQNQIKKLMAAKKTFWDPNSHYPTLEDKTLRSHRQVRRLQRLMKTVMKYTYEPFKHWHEITNNNSTLLPSLGSFVEFHDYLTDSVEFGIVLREPVSKFNENHNKVLVLTLKNELHRVYPPDISFVAYQVLDKDWVHLLEILPNRFDLEHKNRKLVIEVMYQFVLNAVLLRPWVAEHLPVAFSRIANHSRITGCSLASILDQFPEKVFESYFHESAVLLATHLEMCKDVSRWLVPSCMRRSTNIVSLRCSNQLPPDPVYFANSVANMEAITDFLTFNRDELEDFDIFLRPLKAEPRQYDDMCLLFNIWEGKIFKLALDAMKFTAVYPHPELLSKFIKFETLEGNVTPSGLHDLLESIHIFNNSKNPLTDVVLSANLAGESLQKQLAVASTKDLKPSNSELVSAGALDQLEDKFVHLRNSRVFYQDHIVYALPSTKGPSKLAVSLEKVNARKYLVNIHIPDVAAHINPSSDLFAELTSNSSPLQRLGTLIGNDTIELLAQNAREKLLFENNTERKGYFSVGDYYGEEASRSPPKTCMTISFEYLTYVSNPLKDLGSVRVTFDSLKDIQIKSLDMKLLNDTLTGKLEPSLLRPFRLFSRHQREPDDSRVEMDDNDHFNVNFIYNVLNSHFKLRNRHCASTPEPALMNRTMSRQLSYSENEPDSIVTELDIETEADAGKRSKAIFFKNEVEIFCGALVAAYCSRELVPAFLNVQDVDTPKDYEPNEPPNLDEVFISHNNLLLPNYHGNSYYQTLLARDAKGYVSLPAYYIGNNYLGKGQVVVTPGQNLPMGLPGGYVNVTDAMGNMEAFLNQLQILAHVHAKRPVSGSYLSLVEKLSFLKGYGYPIQGASVQRFLQHQTHRLKEAQLATDYIVDRHRNFWALKLLEQRMTESNEDPPIYTCMVTHTGHDLGIGKRLTRALCFELSVEIDILVPLNTDLCVGTTVKCNKVLYIDPVGGRCVMNYLEPY